MTKKYLSIISLIILIGCSNPTINNQENHELIGVLKLTEINLTVNGDVRIIEADESTSLTMILNEDGIYTYSGQRDNQPMHGKGTWFSKENKLTLIEGYKPDELDFTVRGEDIILSETFVNDEGMT